MGQITTVGLDIAKSVFQVHGVDATGEVILKRKLTRAWVVPFFEKLGRCLIGIEACATSHYWARELRRLANLGPRAMFSLGPLSGQSSRRIKSGKNLLSGVGKGDV